MHQQLETVVACSNPKDFSARFKALESSYASTDLFLEDAARWLAPRLYEPFYDQNPLGFYGITSASMAESLFPAERRWRPYAQQLWALRKERKRAPLTIPADTDQAQPAAAPDWNDFASSLESRSFERVLEIARGFLCRPELRDQFRAKLALLALSDSSLGGHKFNYLVQSWLLAERLGFRAVMEILSGPLHLMTFGPHEPSLADRLISSGRQALSAKPETLTPWRSGKREGLEVLLFGSPEEALGEVTSFVGENEQAAVTEFLRTAAAQAIANAARGKWLPVVRAFHTSCLSTEYAQWFEPDDRAAAMVMAGLLINRASAETRETSANRALDETIREFCPTDPFNVLKSVISHSDPFASAAAAYAILGMDEEKKEELARLLMSQAVKNNGEVCRGHDILCVFEAWQSYRHSNSDARGIFLGATAYYLGQVLKNYSLASEYGI